MDYLLPDDETMSKMVREYAKIKRILGQPRASAFAFDEETKDEGKLEKTTESKLEETTDGKSESNIEETRESKAEIKPEETTESRTESKMESKMESKTESRFDGNLTRKGASFFSTIQPFSPIPFIAAIALFSKFGNQNKDETD